MWTAGKGLFLRSCTTWLVLVLFLLSCTAQPPAVKAPSNLPSGSPILLSPKASPAPPKVAYVPAAFSVSVGNPISDKMRQAAKESGGFRIQDYPKTAGCTNCEVLSLESILNWPDPTGKIGTGETLTLGSPDLKGSAFAGYTFGILIPDTADNKGKDENGFTVIQRLAVGAIVHAYRETPYFNRVVAFNGIEMERQDGTFFQTSQNLGGMSLNVTKAIGDPRAEGLCAYSVSTGLQAPAHASIKFFPPTSDQEPLMGKAEIEIGMSGSTSAGYSTWVPLVPTLPEGGWYCAYWNAFDQQASASVKMTVNVPYIKERADTIVVDSIIDTVIPNGEGSKEVQISVEPSNAERPWVLKVKSKNIDPSCSAYEKEFPPHVGQQFITFDASSMADGQYEAVAEYVDINTPRQKGEDTFEVKSYFEIEADPTAIQIGGSSQIRVKKAPVCPGWTITQSGGKHIKVFPASPDINCSPQLFASGKGPDDETGGRSWNGTCTGPHPESGQSVSAPVDIGSVEFEAKTGNQSKKVTVAVSNTAPTPTPCPPGENCPTPPGPSCPPGEVCPPGGPTPTPPGSTPTPTPPGPTEPPPPGPTAPPPPPCIIEICKPRPCPPGKVCTQRPSRAKKQNHRPDPEASPRPSPSGGGGFCPTGTDPKYIQESGFKLSAQTPEAFEDTRELNQGLNQWNNIQDQLNEGGFSTAALKPQKEARLQEKLEEINSRFQDLYWNVRDELDYLEPLRRQLAEVLQRQAGALPNVTLSSNLLAQAENYAQQFKAQKGDLDGLEELKILYSELQTYLWVTQLFIEQDSPNQEVVEALRKLKGQIVNHSEYLAQEYKLFETGDPAEIAAENQEIDSLIAELETAIAELGGDFQIQALSINEIKVKATQLANQLKALKLSKNTSQRIAVLKNSRNFMVKELMSKSSRMTANFVGGGKTKLLDALIKLLRVGLEIESYRRTLQEISCDEASSIKQKFDDFNRLMVLVEKAAQAIAEKITSEDCVKNGDPKVLQAAIEKLLLLGNEQTGSLKVINDKANQTFRLLDKDSDVGPGSAFQKSLDELILLAAHLSQNLGQQLDGLIDACEDKCGDEIQALKDFIQQSNRFNGSGNLSSSIVEPPYNPGVKDQGARTYDGLREVRYKAIFATESPKIFFMAHVLARHGGTKNINRTLAGNRESKFYTDLLAFQSAIEAYSIRNVTGQYPTEAGFDMPSNYWLSINIPGVGLGTGVGFGVNKYGVRLHTKRVYYHFDKTNKCYLNTINPAFGTGDP